MRYFVYADKDATLYEASSSMNTGLDEILEVEKAMNLAATTINVSRPVIKFDLSEISSSIVSGIIPTTARFYLNMYDAGSSGLLVTQSLFAYPVSQSWQMGQGQYFDDPQTTAGASWRYRAPNSEWISGSSDVGGLWYSGSTYIASQSFNLDSNDLRMDVTDIVNNWLSVSVPNEGFIVKRSVADEANTTHLGTFKYFSRDTNTIYPPKLEVAWDNSSWSTGSLTALSSTQLEDHVIYFKGLKPEIKETSKVKFRVVGKPRFVTRTWATSSANLTVNTLPSGSTYYSIRDAVTEDIIIPFDTYSKVSCDSTGNYFTLWANGLQPERYYRVIIKVVTDADTVNENVQYHDENILFKVVR